MNMIQSTLAKTAAKTPGPNVALSIGIPFLMIALIGCGDSPQQDATVDLSADPAANASTAAETGEQRPVQAEASNYQELQAALDKAAEFEPWEIREAAPDTEAFTIQITDDITTGFEEHGELTYTGRVPVVLRSAGETKHTLDAGGHSRILRMEEGIHSFAVENLRFSGRHARADRETRDEGRGGAIDASNVSSLELRQTVFENNEAEADAGAVMNPGIVEDSVFRNNQAENGGALSDFGTETHLIRSVFESNEARRNGGALDGGGQLQVTESEFKENVAGNGGGAIHTNGGVIEKALFQGNQAERQGGAIYARLAGDDWTLQIDETVFEENAAERRGMAIYASTSYDDNALVIADSTFVRNLGSSARAQGTVESTRQGPITVSGSTFEDNQSPVLDASDGKLLGSGEGNTFQPADQLPEWDD